MQGEFSDEGLDPWTQALVEDHKLPNPMSERKSKNREPTPPKLPSASPKHPQLKDHNGSTKNTLGALGTGLNTGLKSHHKYPLLVLKLLLYDLPPKVPMQVLRPLYCAPNQSQKSFMNP